MRWARGLVVIASVACRAPQKAPVVDAAPDVISVAVYDAGDARDAAPDAPDASRVAPEGMLYVPPGTFTMGANEGGEEDEHPAHQVTLGGFFLDAVPVTNEAYAACVASGACRRNDPRVATHATAFLAPKHPVVGVSWDDAHAYCAWNKKRLPREAEYERAMRDDDARRFAWGNDPPTSARAAFGRPLDAGTTDEVGAHPLGRGPFGHDDLAGNVWEWCEDEYDPRAYTRSTADRGVPGSCDEIRATQDELREKHLEGFTGSNPIPFGCDRVLRGGAFNYDAAGLRATNRVHHPASFRLLMAGFRCALSPNE